MTILQTGSEDGGLESPLVSVVMPCLNEEEAIGVCIEKIFNAFAEGGINGEIVVVDNGSTDRSAEIACRMGARVVEQNLRGYGNAYIKGFSEAQGKYLVMGDADDTYDFSLIPQFVGKLEKDNYDFVTGSRYLGRGDANITWLHRYIGNPVLTMVLNALFDTHYTDVYCGYRAFTRAAYDRIAPVSPGMEFNLELAINARLAELKSTEIAIVLAPRKGESKLSTFSDGWRSLRMMLLYCPNKVFLVPGFVLLGIGLLIHAVVIFGLFHVDGRQLGAIAGIFATVFCVVGFQILVLGLHAKTYSWSRRFDQNQKLLGHFYRIFKLETGMLAGLALTFFGLLIFVAIVIEWFSIGLNPLPHPEWATAAATMVIIGVNMIFSSLFISAMSMIKPGGASGEQAVN